MPSFRATALAAVLALAALPAAAHASVVAYDGPATTLTYTAGAGEPNELQLTRAGERVVFQELGGIAIGAPAACDGEGSPLVSCPLVLLAPIMVADVTVALGDADDKLAIGALAALSVAAEGGAGADRLDASGATGFAFLLGGAGADQLLAGLGESDLDGGADGDILTGAPAGARTSYLMGAAADGADVIQGGDGLDVVGYEARASILRLSADGVADDGETGEGDNIGQAVEAILGGNAGDAIVGSNLVDAELSGFGGSDQLTGGAGDDVLFGGDGSDALTGNGGDDVAAASDRAGGAAIGGGPSDAGSDTFAGGPGFDTMDYATRLAPVSATLDGQPNDGEAGEADNVGADVEELIGGRGADTLAGNGEVQRIVGGGGGDTIDPGAGADEVRAGDGNDVIRAQDGSGERIACGLGADTMTGDHNDLPEACETATLGPPPLPADTRKPKVRITGLPSRPRFHHVKRGLRPRIGANETASFVVELLGAATSAHISARRPYNLTLVRRTIARTAKARRISLRPKAALLGLRRKLRVRIRVTATDSAGNVKVATKTLKVRR